MTGPGRVAAIDVGTNTALLLVAEPGDGAPRAVAERATITRLGRGVDRTSRLDAEAMARTVATLRDYADEARRHGASRIDAVCTSAARDASNGEEFLALAEAALGTRPRIIDGREEARLTFRGALTGLALAGDVLVFDVGGGSTELIRGRVATDAMEIADAVSLDIGSVRLTERHVAHDPPRAGELERVRADVRAALAPLPRGGAAVMVGVAGTVTTLSAIHQGLADYDPALVHGSVLARDAIDGIVARLAALPLDGRRVVPGLEPARADVIVAGSLLVLEVLDHFGASELRVSDRGVRWGLARELLGC